MSISLSVELVNIYFMIALTVITAIFIVWITESLLSSLASVDFPQFVIKFSIVQSKLFRVLSYFLAVEEGFLIVEVG